MFSTLGYLWLKAIESLCCSFSQAWINRMKAWIGRRTALLCITAHPGRQRCFLSKGRWGSVPADERFVLHRGILLLLGQMCRRHAGGGFLSWYSCFASPLELSIDPPQLSPCLHRPYIVSCHSLPLSFPCGLHFLTLLLGRAFCPWQWNKSLFTWLSHLSLLSSAPATTVQSPSLVCLFFWNDNHYCPWNPSG